MINKEYDPWITVVIPLYNKQDSITKTINSVLNQSYASYELLIINDGSTDNSLESLKLINDSRIRIINKSNGGVSSARNLGIKEAQFEYVALLDGDDLWEEHYLEEQVRMISDFPDAMMWGTNFAEISNGKLTREVPTGLRLGFRGYVSNYFMQDGRVSDLFHSSAVVINKSVFDQVGGFDERIRYAEDNDMWFRIIATNKVVFYDKYLVKYVQDSENRAMNKPRMLKYFLPYYVDKYQKDIFKANSVFYKWINHWCAIHLRKYYFDYANGQREDANVAVKKLDYSVIPIKYKYLYGMPYCLACLLNKIDIWYHR